MFTDNDNLKKLIDNTNARISFELFGVDFESGFFEKPMCGLNMNLRSFNKTLLNNLYNKINRISYHIDIIYEKNNIRPYTTSAMMNKDTLTVRLIMEYDDYFVPIMLYKPYKSVKFHRASHGNETLISIFY